MPAYPFWKGIKGLFNSSSSLPQSITFGFISHFANSPNSITLHNTINLQCPALKPPTQTVLHCRQCLPTAKLAPALTPPGVSKFVIHVHAYQLTVEGHRLAILKTRKLTCICFSVADNCHRRPDPTQTQTGDSHESDIYARVHQCKSPLMRLVYL